MATVELVEYTTGTEVSDPQTVGAGEVHTLIPVFLGKPGAVQVSLVTSDDGLQPLCKLSSRPSSNKLYQIQGPCEYVVGVRNAGCDVDTGA